MDGMEKTKVYNVDIQATDALKQLAEMQMQAKRLREEQKALGEVTDENAEEYYKLNTQIKETRRASRDYERSIMQSIKLQNAQEDSLEQLRTQLSLDNAELVKLGETAGNEAKKRDLEKRIAATTEELKRQEEALGNHRRSVGDYGKATKELRSELRETINELMNLAAQGDTTSEQYKALMSRAEDLRRAQNQVNRELGNMSQNVKPTDALNNSVMSLTTTYSKLSAVATMGGEGNKELEKAITAVVIVMGALNAIQAMNISLSKTSAAYKAADITLQRIGINQTKAETKALAAKRLMTMQVSASSKIAAAATWLWNAALAANPVVLIIAAVTALIVGITALIVIFARSNKASKEAKKAMDNYNETLKQTEQELDSLNKRLKDNADALQLNADKAVEAAKQRGASAEEVAELELKLIKDLAAAESKGASERITANKQLMSSTQTALKAKEAELETLKEGSKKYKEAAEQLGELREKYEDLGYAINEDSRLIEQNALKVKTAVREHGEAVVAASEEAAKKVADANDKALDSYIKASEKAQQIDEETLKAQNVFLDDNIFARQEYERKLQAIQARGNNERLKAQKDAGKISKKEYEQELALMLLSQQQFEAEQSKALNQHYKQIRNQVLQQAGKTAEEQVGEVISAYDKAMRDIATMEAPIKVSGMSDEEYAKQLADYEEFIYKRAELEARLLKEKDAQIKQIKAEDLAAQFAEFDAMLDEQYAGELDRYIGNEEERLAIEADMLSKKIAMRRASGESVAALEAELQNNRLQAGSIALQKELLIAGNNARAKYEARRKYLEMELKAAEGNQLKTLELEESMRENSAEFWEETLSGLEEYLQVAGELFSQFNNIANASLDRRKQKVESNFNEEKQALADKHAYGVINEAEYNAELMRLENDKEREIAKLERKKAIREKAMRVFSVVTDTAMGIVKAVAASPLTGGLPWSAIVASMGALNLATILAEPLPKARRGMLVSGASHAGGGVRIEAEGGEAIINKRSSSMFMPLLSAINEAGGGVPFTKVGADGGYALRSAKTNGATFTKSDMEEAVQDAFGRVQVIATIRDIERERANYMKMQSSGVITK